MGIIKKIKKKVTDVARSVASKFKKTAKKTVSKVKNTVRGTTPGFTGSFGSPTSSSNKPKATITSTSSSSRSSSSNNGRGKHQSNFQKAAEKAKSVAAGLLNRATTVPDFETGGRSDPIDPTLLLGISTATKAITGIKAVQASTKLSKLSKLGTVGKTSKPISTSSTFAANTKSAKQTESWIRRVATAVNDPKFVAASILPIIGSYPFAGFIKEESLQTISFAVKTATDNGDLEGAREALALQEDILNPDLWDHIIKTVPFVNVGKELNTFYEAAKIKASIDTKRVDDLERAQGGETRDEYFARTQAEKKQDEIDVIDYRNEQRRIGFDYEQEAKADAQALTSASIAAGQESNRQANARFNEDEREAREDFNDDRRKDDRRAEIKARNEDAQFWADYAAQQRTLEAEDRQAVADFWQAYRKEVAKASQDNRPSNLNFGLI